MPEKSIPPDVIATMYAALYSTLWALIGRLLYVINLVRIGRRKRFFTVQTIWELGIAVGMGVIGGALSDYIGLVGLQQAGFISVCSYLGPHAIEMMITWAAHRAGVEPPEDIE